MQDINTYHDVCSLNNELIRSLDCVCPYIPSDILSMIRNYSDVEFLHDLKRVVIDYFYDVFGTGPRKYINFDAMVYDSLESFNQQIMECRQQSTFVHEIKRVLNTTETNILKCIAIREQNGINWIAQLVDRSVTHDAYDIQSIQRILISLVTKGKSHIVFDNYFAGFGGMFEHMLWGRRIHHLNICYLLALFAYTFGTLSFHTCLTQLKQTILDKDID